MSEGDSVKCYLSMYLCNTTLLQLDLHIVPVLFQLKPANGLVLSLCWNSHTASHMTPRCVSHSNKPRVRTLTLLRAIITQGFMICCYLIGLNVFWELFSSVFVVVFTYSFLNE